MPLSIIDQTINIPYARISDLNFQDQLVDPGIVTEYSYRTIEPFENQLSNNRTISPKWSLSSINSGFGGNNTISLSFFQGQLYNQDISFVETFYSKYELANDVRNIYKIVADGKTHLDSVAEAVVKAILAALESFVKAVIELASKAFNWIWSFISKLMNVFISPIMNFFKDSLQKLLNICDNLANKIFSDNNIEYGRGTIIDVADCLKSIIDWVLTPLIVLSAITYLLMVFEAVGQAFPGGMVVAVIGGYIVNILISIILSMAVEYVVSKWLDNDITDIFMHIVKGWNLIRDIFCGICTLWGQLLIGNAVKGIAEAKGIKITQIKRQPLVDALISLIVGTILGSLFGGIIPKIILLAISGAFALKAFKDSKKATATLVGQFFKIYKALEKVMVPLSVVMWFIGLGIDIFKLISDPKWASIENPI